MRPNQPGGVTDRPAVRNPPSRRAVQPQNAVPFVILCPRHYPGPFRSLILHRYPELSRFCFLLNPNASELTNEFGVRGNDETCKKS